MIISDSLFCNGICIDASLVPETLDNFLVLNGVKRDWQYPISLGMFQGASSNTVSSMSNPVLFS